MLRDKTYFRSFLTLLVFIQILVFILSTAAKLNNKLKSGQEFNITTKNPCLLTGCYNEICSNVAINTTLTNCTWKEEFICRVYSTCKLVDGVCAWERTDDLERCLTAITEEEGCEVSGCFGEICANSYMEVDESECTWKPEYECFKFATCGKINGLCSWTAHANYNSCYSEAIRNITTTNDTLLNATTNNDDDM